MLEKLFQTNKSTIDVEAAKPQLFDMSLPSSHKSLEVLLENNHEIQIIDHYVDMLKELFLLNHPQLKDDKLKFHQEFNKWQKKIYNNNGEFIRCGIWAYYPWSRQLVHILLEDEYYQLRIARNNLLVTPTEQKILRNIHVGIIGLSVGQASAITLTISGICKKLSLADPDIIEATNLNRIHAGVADIGIKKVVKISRLITELDPFAEPNLYPVAITKDNINDFFKKNGNLDIVIDAFDDIYMKVQLRLTAREKRIPVIMATDVADGAVLEIDRYDQNQNLKMFGGRINENELHNLPKKTDIKDLAQIAIKIIGVKNTPERMMASIQALGTEIAGYPQLALASFLGGALTTYAIKQIALGNKNMLPRIEISFSDLLH